MDNNFKLNLIGHNERGLIGFINGTFELVYLQKPKNADELIEKMNLPYIDHENVKQVNKDGREVAKKYGSKQKHEERSKRLKVTQDKKV